MKFLKMLSLVILPISVFSLQSVAETKGVEIKLSNEKFLKWNGSGQNIELCETSASGCHIHKMPKSIMPIQEVKYLTNLDGARATWLTKSYSGGSYICAIAENSATTKCVRLIVPKGEKVNSVVLDDTRTVLEDELVFARYHSVYTQASGFDPESQCVDCAMEQMQADMARFQCEANAMADLASSYSECSSNPANNTTKKINDCVAAMDAAANSAYEQCVSEAKDAYPEECQKDISSQLDW